MNPQRTSALEPVDLGRLHEMLRSPSPCITLFLPPYRPGEPASPASAILKTNLQDAARQLADRGLPRTASDNLLAPIEDLANDLASVAGSRWGRAILRSPDTLYQFQLTLPAKQSLTVAGCLAIRKLLSELWVPRLFYILALSKKSVGLFRCTNHHSEAVELPRGTQATLEAALAFRPPDHDLENRSTVGVSAGAMRATRFGTGSGRETERAHLSDYYKLVDHGIQELLHNAGIPLLLAGVDEDTSAYRAVSAYPGLVGESLRGSPNLSSQGPETVLEAYSLLRAAEMQREAKTVMEARERTTPGRFSTDPEAILHAAFEGRVHELYLDENAERSNIFESETYRSGGKEDLLNLAAVQTILRRGKAFELPKNMMPDGAAAAAVMRF